MAVSVSFEIAARPRDGICFHLDLDLTNTMGAMLTIALVLLPLGFLILIIGQAMLLVAAFRTSVGWGLLVLFVPFGALAYWLGNREAAKAAIQVHILGLLLSALSGVLIAKAGIGQLPLPDRMREKYGLLTEEEKKAAAKRAAELAAARAKAAAAANTNTVTEADTSFVGKTLAELRETRGYPRGIGRGKHGVIWIYEDYQYVSDNGKTITKREAVGQQ